MSPVQQRRRATLQDIAVSLGLSVNTVSRALSDKGGVSERTRSKIRSEAERLGYVPNVHARSLVLGSRMMIGLVITNPSNPFYAELISEIELHAVAAGYTLVLLLSDESSDRESSAAGTLLRSGVDAAIVVPVQGPHNPWIQLERAGIPVVLVNRELEACKADLVSTDNLLGAYNATSHVIKAGASTVIMLEEDLQISTIRQRIEGFKRAMSEEGLPVDDGNIVSVPTRRSHRAVLPWQADDAYRVSKDLLSRQHSPDAFVVGNDYFALGLYRALREHNLDIPHDTMVVGFGDYPFAEFLTPPLSTVRLPARKVGKRAMELVLARISEHNHDKRKSELFAPELVIRESTRGYKGKTSARAEAAPPYRREKAITSAEGSGR